MHSLEEELTGQMINEPRRIQAMESEKVNADV